MFASSDTLPPPCCIASKSLLISPGLSSGSDCVEVISLKPTFVSFSCSFSYAASSNGISLTSSNIKKEELIQKLTSYKIEVNISDNNSQIIKEDRIVFENEYKTPRSQGIDNLSNSENSDTSFNIVNIEKKETE